MVTTPLELPSLTLGPGDDVLSAGAERWPERHRPHSPGGATERSSVLLVEDDDALREHLADCLRDAGFDVVCAGDGVQALHLLERLRPHAAVVDLDLPGITGFRLLRLLRRDPDPALAQLPVVVTSGCHHQEAREIFDDGPPDAYLHKPFPADRLVEDLRRLVAASTARPAAAR